LNYQVWFVALQNISTLSLSAEAKRPSIGLLSLSAIPDDPRVRRQGDLLHAAGYDVVAVGLPGHHSPEPDWTCLAIEASDDTGAARPIRKAIYRAGRVAGLFRVAVEPDYANRVYWSLNGHFRALYELARTRRPAIWLANDWNALPIAQRLAREQGVPFAYDTHELAVDEYGQNLRWKLTVRPIIAGIEAAGLRDAAFATCVSDGIADRLQAVHGLKQRPVVVRNIPSYHAHSIRPTGEVIKVLYHGIVSPGRGLEACIQSVRLWQPQFHLTIRGPGDAAYLGALQALADADGVGARVSFDGPVAMTDMVERAADFDVGLFALPDHSLQNTYVLPNKFFEYMMAGLAMCVSDLPEMTRLVKQHDLGELIPQASPQMIADAINRMDAGSIDRFKANCLEAAKTLNWEREGLRLVELCGGRG
jgi:glycosyltransferase involved in cell wall biosynthesis